MIAILCATTTFAQTFSISGKLDGLPEGTTLQLIPAATHQDEKPIATATVKEGSFQLTSTTDFPRQYYISVKDSYGVIPIVINKGDKVSITATAKLNDSQDNKFYSFTDEKITGAPLTEEYNKKMSPRFDLDKLHGDIQQKYAPISAKMSAARASKDSVLASEIAQSEEWIAYEKAEGDFFKKADEVIGKIISDNNDSWWGPLLTLNLYNYFTPQNEHLYDNLSENVKSSYYGQILKEQVRPEGFLNKMAPTIAAKTVAGETLNLQQSLSGKKVVLIDFWASWCAPCRKKIPELKALYEKYKDQGLEIVGISIDKKADDWKKALGEEQLPYPNYLDQGETANNWKVRAIPALFLVDSTGKVIAENVALEEIAKYLK